MPVVVALIVVIAGTCLYLAFRIDQDEHSTINDALTLSANVNVLLSEHEIAVAKANLAAAQERKDIIDETLAAANTYEQLLLDQIARIDAAIAAKNNRG